MQQALAQFDPSPSLPEWAVGKLVYLDDVPQPYHASLRSIGWGEEALGEMQVPEWALRVCVLSRRGASLRLRAWIEWCAAAGVFAERRAILIEQVARTMEPGQALRMIEQMVCSRS